MTLIKAYTLVCDWPLCVSSVGGVTARAGHSGEAAHRQRAIASSHGWRRIAGQDICPSHVAQARAAEFAPMAES